MNSKSIWLVNIGEPLPTEGNKKQENGQLIYTFKYNGNK